MSTAVPFSALGAGNGFDECLPLVNAFPIDIFDASPTEVTRKEAMKFVWLLENYESTFALTWTEQYGTNPVQNIQADFEDVTMMNLTTLAVNETTVLTPNKRVCLLSGFVLNFRRTDNSDTVKIEIFLTNLTSSKMVGFGYNVRRFPSAPGGGNIPFENPSNSSTAKAGSGSLFLDIGATDSVELPIEYIDLSGQAPPGVAAGATLTGAPEFYTI